MGTEKAGTGGKIARRAGSDTGHGSSKFLELMVHNKRLSVPKLVMSVHAGLISFPAFNKYVAAVIRHNFSTRRDPVHALDTRAPSHLYTDAGGRRWCALNARRTRTYRDVSR